ncbi:hypothetical protein Goklo_006103 [Gossypium klotzschianum]|uniref:Uncharacterized protein n=1 Tax=Gossypium klotzschianum TaxID=34286 RepID=A0A7J8VGF9_9ROSI|nr:hypothetical protein [Gossypium klotzschianum]
MDVESLSAPFELSDPLEINGFMKDIRDLEQRQRNSYYSIYRT